MLMINPLIENQFKEEPCFEIFKHADLICCVQRLGWAGNFNGYVRIGEDHRLFGKGYNSKIAIENMESVAYNGNIVGVFCLDHDEFESGLLPLSVFINVHCGLTFAYDSLYGIDDNLFGKSWWFGFDTMHSGDMKVFLNDIDRQYDCSDRETYRDFEFVKQQVKSLAEQLSQLK